LEWEAEEEAYWGEEEVYWDETAADATWEYDEVAAYDEVPEWAEEEWEEAVEFEHTIERGIGKVAEEVADVLLDDPYLRQGMAGALSWTFSGPCPNTGDEFMWNETYLVVSNHWDDDYNGYYIRGNDWNNRPHFVKGIQHLYYQPSSWWQFDNTDQEVEGFWDRSDGGYASGYDGCVHELYSSRYMYFNGYEVEIEIAFGDISLLPDPYFSAPDIQPGQEYLSISGHSDPWWDGVYTRGNDWNNSPHFAMGDRHFYYNPTN
jgi:hypothetical protein